MNISVMKIATSSIVTAFDGLAIGTKVLDATAFLDAATAAIVAYEFPENGQGFIALPEDAHQLVSAGVAKLDGIPDDDLFIKTWRGRREICAPRARAAKVEALHVVVYTLDGYRNDPDAEGDGEEARAMRAEVDRYAANNVTHVLVAVLAFAAPKAPYGPLALLHNVAGGNNEFLPKTAPEAFEIGGTTEVFADPGELLYDVHLLHKIIGHAKETLDYAREWVLVADRG